VLDPSSLNRAVAGQDAAVSALGHKRWLGPSRILSEGTRNLIAAMDHNGADVAAFMLDVLTDPQFSRVTVGVAD
jgi:putative NADH-flavin reductase